MPPSPPRSALGRCESARWTLRPWSPCGYSRADFPSHAAPARCRLAAFAGLQCSLRPPRSKRRFSAADRHIAAPARAASAASVPAAPRPFPTSLYMDCTPCSRPFLRPVYRIAALFGRRECAGACGCVIFSKKFLKNPHFPLDIYAHCVYSSDIR